ncbi:PAS domain-containing sensor histidine kinase [Sphingomonas sp. BIUV-7]|uniref:histidine kinase n=1 Tax=Sphingomonas natans TaxID=3063330 RepID=A0ABT8Y569_9SPHN|nr:PAS domain-containing sensor histidine kinase [Sphingomonas sp. BIUV-7]MDO6413464.1 PAS domain-containing sensor histidine kinase [Sphingomonas sp. BIUV-7]
MIFAFRGLDERAHRILEVADRERRLLAAQMIGEMGEWSYDAARDLVRLSPMLSWLYGLRGRLEMTLEEARHHISPEDRELGNDAFHTVLKTGESRQYNRVATLADGTQRVRRVIVYPTRDAEGTIIGFHGFDQDVTVAKRLEILESRIADLARLDAMHLMAATLAHEINQPLTAAGNYLAASRMKLLRAGADSDPEIEKLIRSGEAQVRNAGEIIRRVQQMVLKQDERSPVVITDAWDKAAQLIETASSARTIRFESDIGSGADIVCADAVQVAQVFTNLMRNAVDAVSEGDVVIGLKTRVDQAGDIHLSVRDNGSGIAVSDREFFALLAPVKKSGLGLGLVITRTIVESHRGKIWIESTGPEGSVITFRLPAQAA